VTTVYTAPSSSVMPSMTGALGVPPAPADSTVFKAFKTWPVTKLEISFCAVSESSPGDAVMSLSASARAEESELA
jgi:hypothetical protein